MKHSPSRREFVAIPFVLPFVRFPSQLRQRLAVSTYPFRDVMISPGKPSAGKLTLQLFAATLVAKFGVYGIEPWSRHFESLDPAYLADLAAAFKSAGVRVVNIPCDVAVKLCGSEEQRKTALAVYREWVDAAVVLGSPSIRVHCPAGEDPSDISCAVAGLKALAQYGTSKNIVINLENDDPKSEDPQRIVKVLKAVDSKYLRSLPDFCNSMLIQNDQDYNARSLAALYPYAYNISHVKDVEFSDGKAYRVDVDRIFAIAEKAHYKGFFSMESESDQDPYPSTMKLIEAAIKNLSSSAATKAV